MRTSKILVTNEDYLAIVIARRLFQPTKQSLWQEPMYEKSDFIALKGVIFALQMRTQKPTLQTRTI
ncbi:hypothetical protein ASE74_15730 [Pedobacter sp. Leaf216]|nr:hypothetical protein ASE74_15730 [Pedobacter sp. Leaf216]